MYVQATLLLFGSARELAKFSEKEILVPATTNKCELMQFIFDEVKIGIFWKLLYFIYIIDVF